MNGLNHIRIISDKTQDIAQLCQRFHVRRLFVFGSILTPDFTDCSDIDFAVEFYPTADNNIYHDFYDLYESLSSLFERRIDLIDQKGVKNPYFLDELISTRQLIYGTA